MSAKTRSVLFVLLGVIGLVLKGRYSGTFRDVVHSYGGNVAASFAVYFILTNLPVRFRFRGLVTACLALAAVNGFEATDGFKIMSNTYDPLDFAANTVGVALAFWIDAATRPIRPQATIN